MKIIAHGNGHTYTVNYIEFKGDGTVKWVYGFMDWHGHKNHPIGANAKCINLDKEVKLEVVYE